MIKNAQPEPTAAITTPATAGPTIWATFTDVEFSATAFDRWSSPTRSETKVWRAGESMALTQPDRNART